MDETLAEFFRRTILKIPMTEMMTILKTWNFLSENQLQTVNFRRPPLENNPEIPPSSREEGLRLLHGLATNLATSLQTPQEA